MISKSCLQGFNLLFLVFQIFLQYIPVFTDTNGFCYCACHTFIIKKIFPIYNEIHAYHGNKLCKKETLSFIRGCEVILTAPYPLINIIRGSALLVDCREYQTVQLFRCYALLILCNMGIDCQRPRKALNQKISFPDA